MPEIRFEIKWPDGSTDICYSPSLVVKNYFSAGTDYQIDDFLERSRTSLNIASDRVEQKYGMPCSLALSQLRQIEDKSKGYSNQTGKVRLIKFLE